MTSQRSRRDHRHDEVPRAVRARGKATSSTCKQFHKRLITVISMANSRPRPDQPPAEVLAAVAEAARLAGQGLQFLVGRLRDTFAPVAEALCDVPPERLREIVGEDGEALRLSTS